MKNLGFYDGTFDEIEKMMIPFDDRVHYYGDGVYDATCAGNHVIFNLDEHIERFFNSAGLLKIVIPYTKEELNIIKSIEYSHCFGKLTCGFKNSFDSFRC